MEGTCRMNEVYETFIKVLVCIIEEIQPFQRTRRRWEKNFKIYFKVLGVRMWSELIWLRIMFMVMNVHFLYKAGNFVTSRATSSFLRRTMLCGIS